MIFFFGNLTCHSHQYLIDIGFLQCFLKNINGFRRLFGITVQDSFFHNMEFHWRQQCTGCDTFTLQPEWSSIQMQTTEVVCR